LELFMNSDRSVLNEVEALVRQSSDARIRGDWLTVNALLKHALVQLGGRYQSRDVVDDTGARLILADTRVVEGDLRSAADMRLSVVAIRMDMLRNALQSLA
jgi:hypothetical protein